MNDEEVKKRILARRAAFVAAAIAGVAGASCDSHPFACLEPPVASGHGTMATPQPCLSEAIVPRATDAGATIDASRADAGAGAEAGAGAGAEAGAGADASPDAGAHAAGQGHPRPCLSAPPPSKPDAGVLAPLACLYINR